MIVETEEGGVMPTGIRKTKGSSKVAGGAAVDNGRRCHVLEYC